MLNIDQRPYLNDENWPRPFVNDLLINFCINSGWIACNIHQWKNTFKFGLETTLSIQEWSKVNLVQSLSTQWKFLDTVTVKCLWSVSQPHLESVTGAVKITIATCTFFLYATGFIKMSNICSSIIGAFNRNYNTNGNNSDKTIIIFRID